MTRQAAERQARGLRRAALASAGLLCSLFAASAFGGRVAAEPAPVAPGLWEVQMLALFQPDPQPGAVHWPGLPGKPRARVYRICLDAPRARAPMSAPAASPGAQRVSDDMSVTVRDTSAAGTRNAASGEWLYRRLSEREFEGSQSLYADTGVEMTLQYRSVFVQHDCAGVLPSAMSKFGEP
jgi:hypothetical protein